MGKLVKFDLKQELDNIDSQIFDYAYAGLYNSKYKILIGTWEKGEKIGEFTGGKIASWRELERQTGRNHESLKKWHDLYLKYPNKEDYIEIEVKPKAETWVQKLLMPKEIKAIDSPALPDGKFNVIYCDPPWSYGDKQNIPSLGGAEKHYSTMTIEQLCTLPIKDISTDNAVLFLWVTSPLLDECWDVIAAWGFEYKSSFIWDKVKHNMGHYNSVRHELLLICTKGTFLPESNKLQDSVISIDRTDKHSEKPEEFRELIEEMYPTAKKIELFAREQHEGWKSWGNEI